MIDGFLSDLLNKKWNNYVKLRFYFELILFVSFFLICFVCVFMNRSYFDFLVRRDADIENEMKTFHNDPNNTIFTPCIYSTPLSRTLTDKCKCAYLFPIDPNRYVKFLENLLIKMGNVRKLSKFFLVE